MDHDHPHPRPNHHPDAHTSSITVGASGLQSGSTATHSPKCAPVMEETSAVLVPTMGDTPEPEVVEPSELMCPITKCMFRIPVKVIESGHTYERDAICTHLMKSPNDPLTRLPVSSEPVLDRETYATVESWLEAHPHVTPQGWDDRQIPTFATLDALVCARHGDTQGLVSCIEQGANINEKDGDGIPAVIYAARARHYDVVQLLLSSGADFNLGDKHGATLAFICAQEGDSHILKLLLDHGWKVVYSDDEAQYHHGWTCLHEASERGHVEVIKLLLQNGAKVETKDEAGETALHTAVQSSTEVYKILLDSINDVDATDVVGRTALHTAAMCGKIDHVKLLVDSGADINVRDIDSHTALHLAISEGNLEVVQELLSSDEKVEFEHSEYSFLHCVLIGVQSDKKSTVTLLLGKCLDVLGLDLNEHAYHRAAELGNESMIKMFLDRGVSVGCLHALSGATALHSAARNGHVHVAKYLLDMGIDASIIDCSSKTALQIARDNGNSQLVSMIEGCETRSRRRRLGLGA